MTAETVYTNLYLNLITHKILKEGLQSTYVKNQLVIVENLLSSKNFDLNQIDLFRFAHFIIAIFKFSKNTPIIQSFLNRI